MKFSSTVFSPQESKLIEEEFAELKTNYFNSAYFGPSPLRCKESLDTRIQLELDPSFTEYEDFIHGAERSRELFARFLGTSAYHIAHSTSCSDMISKVMNGYPWKEGDVAVSIDGEYPSDVLPWMVGEKHYPYQFHLLPRKEVPTASWLAENLPKETKVFAISHVSFDTGRKVDLLSIGKLCQERNILFIADVTQSLGSIQVTPEELETIDVLVCSSYKWMLGPYGHAFAYFSEKAIQTIAHKSGDWLITPKSESPKTLTDYTLETHPGAKKFDRGQAPNFLVLSSMSAALDFFLDLDLTHIQKHNESLRDHFIELLPKRFQLVTPKNREDMGTILCIRSDHDSMELKKTLWDNNFDSSVRGGNVRLSFHLFNTTEQVEKLISLLAK